MLYLKEQENPQMVMALRALEVASDVVRDNVRYEKRSINPWNSRADRDII